MTWQSNQKIKQKYNILDRFFDVEKKGMKIIMNKIITLDELPLNKNGYIEKIECKRKYSKKIIRLRICKGG